MLIDKGYYDYDYEKPKEAVKAEKHERTHEQTQSLFTRMGFGKVKKLGEDKPLTPDEMQQIAMQEAREKKNKGGTE